MQFSLPNSLPISEPKLLQRCYRLVSQRRLSQLWSGTWQPTTSPLSLWYLESPLRSSELELAVYMKLIPLVSASSGFLLVVSLSSQPFVSWSLHQIMKESNLTKTYVSSRGIPVGSYSGIQHAHWCAGRKGWGVVRHQVVCILPAWIVTLD